jgi:hypothetical protein
MHAVLMYTCVCVSMHVCINLSRRFAAHSSTPRWWLRGMCAVLMYTCINACMYQCMCVSMQLQGGLHIRQLSDGGNEVYICSFNVHMRVRINVCMYQCMCASMHVCINAFMYQCMCVSTQAQGALHIFQHLEGHMYIHTYTRAHIKSGIHISELSYFTHTARTHTPSHTNTHTHTQTHTHTHTGWGAHCGCEPFHRSWLCVG